MVLRIDPNEIKDPKKREEYIKEMRQLMGLDQQPQPRPAEGVGGEQPGWAAAYGIEGNPTVFQVANLVEGTEGAGAASTSAPSYAPPTPPPPTDGGNNPGVIGGAATVSGAEVILPSALNQPSGTNNQSNGQNASSGGSGQGESTTSGVETIENSSGWLTGDVYNPEDLSNIPGFGSVFNTVPPNESPAGTPPGEGNPDNINDPANTGGVTPEDKAGGQGDETTPVNGTQESQQADKKAEEEDEEKKNKQQKAA